MSWTGEGAFCVQLVEIREGGNGGHWTNQLDSVISITHDMKCVLSEQARELLLLLLPVKCSGATKFNDGAYNDTTGAPGRSLNSATNWKWCG